MTVRTGYHSECGHHWAEHHPAGCYARIGVNEWCPCLAPGDPVPPPVGDDTPAPTRHPQYAIDWVDRVRKATAEDDTPAPTAGAWCSYCGKPCKPGKRSDCCGDAIFDDPPPVGDDTPAPTKCPTCESPDPDRHPAVQWEGEVHPCSDPWHTPRCPDCGVREGSPHTRQCKSVGDDTPAPPDLVVRLLDRALKVMRRLTLTEPPVPVGDDTPAPTGSCPECGHRQGVHIPAGGCLGVIGGAGCSCKQSMADDEEMGDDTPAPTAPWAATRLDALRNLRREGYAVVDKDALNRAGATPDLTDQPDRWQIDGPDHDGYHRVSDGTFHVLAPTSIAAHVADLLNRAGATPDLTALLDAYGRYKKAFYGVEKRTGQADVLAAVAALVRSAQNDTDAKADQ